MVCFQNHFCHLTFPLPDRRKILNHIAAKLCIAFTVLALTGCGVSTENNALKKGAVPLSVDEIYSLVNNNTLRLVSSDFDAHVFLAENGKLSANSLKNSDDTGLWDIKNNASLCLKFDLWYYGDVNCYSVYRETERNSYLLYTTNGSIFPVFLYYSYKETRKALDIHTKVRENNLI